jgi:hypothetical protein
MIETLFSNKQGSGYISDNEHIPADFIPASFSFQDGSIETNQKTDLFGFFPFEVLFCGAQNNEMLFLIGTTTNLFETTYYYQQIWYISPVRILLRYSHLGFRDYNYINKKWK